ncbi:hypothetical protein Hs20B_11520 [Lactococcus insecticola]|uniref:Uncharacterized protein n=1 Tax=Pseudolactococcus insecticola TaxID=2709158 RepID=A0A6A0B8X0_9LACT|nr:hypothetical protein Hs20B_11520 [Lactococcus insecticola]
MQNAPNVSVLTTNELNNAPNVSVLTTNELNNAAKGSVLTTKDFNNARKNHKIVYLTSNVKMVINCEEIIEKS